MLYLLYSAVTTAGYLTLAALSPAIRFLGGGTVSALTQRLGTYPVPLFPDKDDRPVLWIHASSVGEVQAARGIIAELEQDRPGYRMVLTTMTVQGQRIARRQLSRDIPCLLAPLDAPGAVRAALRQIRPDLYLCLETELWPAMLTQLKRQGIAMLLLNGRISEHSFAWYRRLGSGFSRLLSGFDRIATITEADRSRFAALGVPADRLIVCGNLKYDQLASEPDGVRRRRREQLGAEGATVFVCGSTRTGEEELLLQVFRGMNQRTPTLWVVAPRHLERADSVEDMLVRSGLEVTRYTTLTEGRQRGQVILVDCMGELAELYAAGDFLFCGGSLVAKGGHNIMEAARWGRPVYFGPHMKDFRDAAALLTSSGGGFQAADSSELLALILAHLEDRSAYEQAATAAGRAAAAQQGATGRQARLVREAVQNRIAQRTVPKHQ